MACMRRSPPATPATPATPAARRAHRAGLAALALLAATGCSTAPTATPLAARAAPPAAFAGAAAAGPAAAGEPVAPFWQRFGDADLDRLMADALVANGSLQVAAARVRETRALARAADAERLPATALGTGATRSRARDADGNAQTRNRFNATAELAWEADLFGRIAAGQRAAAYDAAAAEADRQALQVAVAAEVARAYFELRSAQALRALAADSLALQREALALVDARAQAGRGTELDVQRARTLVGATEAALPAFEGAAERALIRLAVLTGRGPGAAALAPLASPRPLPGLPPTALAAIGSPESMLRRRPDIAAAEAQLAAASARLAEQRAALFPRITLGGALGLASGRVSELTDAASLAWQVGAQLVWTGLDFGRQRARIDAATAREEAALARWEDAVRGALGEAEAAFAGYTRAQQTTAALAAAAGAADRAAAITRARFDVGASDFTVVLDAERERVAATDSLAQSQAASALALVDVYRALSGGWPEPK
jgi:multidrug efflux system outer membrane protein